MVQNPLVSVIVPAYNSAAFIGDAIDSLLGQSLADIEIIVVDDGSEDATYSVAESRAEADPRVRVLHLEANSGHPSRARNVGIRSAKGQYIAFLDADDVSLPDRLSSAIDAIRRTGAGIAFGDIQRLYNDTGALEKETVLGQRQFLKLATDRIDPVGDGIFRCRPEFAMFMLAHFEAIMTQTIVFARALLERDETVFDEDLLTGEDLDLFYRLVRRSSVAYIDRVHGFYRIRADSLTRTVPEQTLLDGATVRLKYLSMSKDISRSDARLARQRIARALADVGYSRWCTGRRSAAREIYSLSLRVNPTKAAFVGFLKAFISRDLAVKMMSAAYRSDR